ncbi:Peroxidase [Arachis hypogaea]|uniref:peroxidase n=1 Tax=Arachis hypogaea TaxID=3818 RepID=A0A6B9V9V8_ARAHY|nr:Peroxidase [Arachis hypogaea]
MHVIMLSKKLLVLLVVLSVSSSLTSASLTVGFYKRTCPHAEAIVRSAVNKAISLNEGIAPALIRMHFHDCFVRGCDGSVLLESTPGNPAERDHPANNPSLRGFHVIEEAKAQIESLCPETVSCADILAFAARDSAYKSGDINYAVPAGRRDGRVSISQEVTENLPAPTFNADQLITNFARKGLSADELVTLSGAHSIGVSHCSSFSNRLYTPLPQDPPMDSEFSSLLKTKCPSNVNGDGGFDPTVVIDAFTPKRLDNKYYKGLMKQRGLLSSDQALLSSESTSEMVVSNAKHGLHWSVKFAKAMVRMGSIDVLTGEQGEIRRHCSLVDFEFKAKFLFSVGSIYKTSPLMVMTSLRSEESKDDMRSGREKRLDEEENCRLVGVAKIDSIDDFLMNSFLTLPIECLADLNFCLILKKRSSSQFEHC